MNDRTAKLRQQSLDTPPSLSAERAVQLTEFYQANAGLFSVPVLRAKSFLHLCQHKTIYIGAGELIVGERGPAPKVVPTFPELTCHSAEDLRILNSRPKTWYRVDDEAIRLYEEKVIPYWRGRSLRDQIFAVLPEEWLAAYNAGIFTEFMEQRAPGHTVLDDKIYSKGMVDFKRDIANAISKLDFLTDPLALDKQETLKSFDIACDAIVVFAKRHAALALELAAQETDPQRRTELNRIAEICTRVPANAPRNFQEALQYYWFCHQAVITELNGWDSFNPGHLDQHLLPFYRKGIADGSLTPESARELLECFFIKFNNHPAPPKVGVTAAESGTYTDFANINIGGLLRDGSDGSNEISHLLLEIVEEMHLLQPSTNIQLSRKSPDHFLKHTLRVVSKGYGFPSIFNADAVVQEQLRQGKSLEDARGGGCSGCVEVGAFGKEAYILTGYFNMPKCLELALHDGVDPQTGKQLGPRTGSPDSFQNFDDVFAAYQAQFRHFLGIKLKGNHLIGRLYATVMPAPFLSVMTDDCVVRGLDYNSGGARYNNTYVQFVGLGTLADSFSAIRQMSFDDAGTTRGSRVAAGGPSAASSHILFSPQDKPVSITEAPGAQYSKRNLPHFEKPWAIYHITFSTVKGRDLAPEDRDIVLNCIRHWNERRYRLSAACVMSDHFHMIIQPGIESQDPDGNPIFYPLSTILHTIKSFTAHEINNRTGSKGSLWEKESFDRYLRSDADLEGKFHYVLRNPWTAGLVSSSQAYPWVWPSDGMDEVSAGRQNQHAGRVCSPLVPLPELVAALDKNFVGQEVLRQRLLHKTRKYGNDDDYADDLMVRIFDACFDELDGRPDHKGGRYRIEMLPTTCHVYFGSVTGATPDGRSATLPVSEGISPVQGADRHGPTAVIRSASKMDHLKAGGTLLNLKFTPALVFTEEGIDKWSHLVRSYFKMDGHHIQFNVVRADTLREAQKHPDQHRDLIVRVAGYSDYFCDLSTSLQEEIITRTEHETFQNAGI